MVAPASHKSLPSLVLLRILLELSQVSHTGLSPPLVAHFQRFLLLSTISYWSPTTPSVNLVWAFPFSLVATKRISVISFPLGNEIFQFPRFPSRYKIGTPTYNRRKVSLFGDRRIKACLTALRRVSPSDASFFGNRCHPIAGHH